jgi:hypothetical protein
MMRPSRWSPVARTWLWRTLVVDKLVANTVQVLKFAREVTRQQKRTVDCSTNKRFPAPLSKIVLG